MLDALTAEEVKFSFRGPGEAACLRAADDGKSAAFLYVILPVTTTGE